MALGALILSAGTNHAADITSLAVPAGSVSAGQRMIAAFQRAGVAQIWLVTGAENKKAERMFVGNGVFFLHQEPAAQTMAEALDFAMANLPKQIDRVFVACGDAPLFLPETLQNLLREDADVVRPVFGGDPGWPVLLKRSAYGSGSVNGVSRKNVPVTDPGVLPMEQNEAHLLQHSNQLLRPMVNVEITQGIGFYDRRLSALLHLVDETQSVREACRMMQISYSVAWQMLNHAEEVTGFPLISRNRGGPAGQGSLLTEQGRKLMGAYDGFSSEMEKAANRLYQEEFAGYLD